MSSKDNLNADGTSPDSHQYLTFSARDEMFALSILNVKEIIEYGDVTEIPLMPDFIKGVINLRGSVVPVVDLRARFGGGLTRIQRRSCIVIVELIHGDQHQVLGILVDAVSEVLDIPTSEIEPPPMFGASIRADFISGIGKVSGRFVIILEMSRVLSVEEMSMLTSIQNTAGLSDSSNHSAASLNAG